MDDDPTQIKERLRADAVNQYLCKRGSAGIKQNIKQIPSIAQVKDSIILNKQSSKSYKNILTQRKETNEETERK